MNLSSKNEPLLKGFQTMILLADGKRIRLERGTHEVERHPLTQLMAADTMMYVETITYELDAQTFENIGKAKKVEFQLGVAELKFGSDAIEMFRNVLTLGKLQ